ISFLMVVAAHHLFPEAHIIIDHSVTLGGFFCQVEGRPLFAQEELEAVEARMRAIIAADEPIIKQRMPTEEAVALFQAQGYDDKVRLMQSYEGSDVTVYSLCGVQDYFYGHMMPSTGKLHRFCLELYPPGFIIRLPQRFSPTSLPASRDYPKLMEVYRRYREWINILGVADVGALNAAVASGEIRKAILVAEALHEKRISDIADAIVARRRETRVVLIAGPSSSGKTTFARRLAIQLMVTSLRPFALALDDYFVDRDQSPLDEAGNYDFEALEAIDVHRFNRDLMALMAGQRVRLPHYDFKSGKSVAGEEAQLNSEAIILVEGIHGLNPALVPELPPECVFRVYASALTQLNIDHHNRVPTTDTRLLRRIVRDARSRGYLAQDTIGRWESVRRGEERNIFPYQENADVMFNSALVYELAVLKPFAEPLLLRVPEGTEEALEARRLLAFLRWVRPCEPDLVPDNSLLREFIGGSILQDFQF
ncbi:MAG: nucleoside kinase, partial [Anaerolineae bacterium]|nr:nucleoside kinase [Anaerolineae bacterium]